MESYFESESKPAGQWDKKEIIREMRQFTASPQEGFTKSPKRQKSRDSRSPLTKSPIERIVPIENVTSWRREERSLPPPLVEGKQFWSEQLPRETRSPSLGAEFRYPGESAFTSSTFSPPRSNFPIQVNLSPSSSTEELPTQQLLSSEPLQSRVITATSYSKNKKDDVDLNITNSIAEMILRAREPIEVQESETISVQGQRGLFANKQDVRKWQSSIPLDSYPINVDENPQVICKKTPQPVTVIQDCVIRYLRPPTPPAPGDLVVKLERAAPAPEAPPIVIRQQASLEEEKQPFIVREMPPKMPKRIESKTITVFDNRLALPPRKVIVERLPQLPLKPPTTIIERWLPYKELPRRVIFQEAAPAAPLERIHNLIIQWEAPKVIVKQEIHHEDVMRMEPEEYVRRHGDSLRSAQEMPEFVRELPLPQGIQLAADFHYKRCPVLEGDVHALRLVDLEKERLGEYRETVKKHTEHVLRSVFRWGREHCDKEGLLKREDACVMLDMLRDRLGSKFLVVPPEQLLEKFEQTGTLDFEKFKDMVVNNLI